jgi:uncharacterized membrane protein
MGRHDDAGGLTTGRIAALADGVFAVAMTLLVLEFHVPALPEGATSAHLDAALARLWPQVLSYVAGFLVLGTLWIGHHYQLHYVRRADRTFLWLNLGFLLMVTFLPFCVALLGTFGTFTTPCVLYGASLLVAGSFLMGQWSYATNRRRLVEAALEEAVVRALRSRIQAGMLVYCAGFALAFVAPRLSLAAYAAMPLLYFVPSRIDRHSMAHPPQSGG